MPKQYRKYKGVFKRCVCAEDCWPTCQHPWHFDYYRAGKNYRHSLKKLAWTRGDREPITKAEALDYVEKLRAEIRATGGVRKFRPPPVLPPAPVPEPEPEPKTPYVANKAALEVAKELEALGCRVWMTGWPDLLVMHGATLFAVEVKYGTQRMTQAQTEVKELLWRVGIAAFEVRKEFPDEALSRYLNEREAHAGRSSIIHTDVLYRAVRDRGDQPIQDHLFVQQQKQRLTLGVCNACQHTVVFTADEVVTAWRTKQDVRVRTTRKAKSAAREQAYAEQARTDGAPDR